MPAVILALSPAVILENISVSLDSHRTVRGRLTQEQQSAAEYFRRVRGRGKAGGQFIITAFVDFYGAVDFQRTVDVFNLTQQIFRVGLRLWTQYCTVTAEIVSLWIVDPCLPPVELSF